MDKKRLTATEKESLQRLNIAFDILSHEKENLSQRAAMIPGAKRDMAMMATKIERLMEGMVDTIPNDQLLTYKRALQMVSYIIGVKRPGGMPQNEKDYGMWLPFEVINVILANCHDHCLMCDLDKSRRKACPLKKALDTIPNDVADRPDNDCPYYTVI